MNLVAVFTETMLLWAGSGVCEDLGFLRPFSNNKIQLCLEIASDFSVTKIKSAEHCQLITAED